jgi:membrane-bound lytic murein transglycosylase B
MATGRHRRMAAVGAPPAARSARRAGKSIAKPRKVVRTDFRCTSTCQHRNDLISSMTALPALVSTAHNRGRHRSRKRDNRPKSTRLSRFRKCSKGRHAKDHRVRIAGSSGARPAIAPVRHKGIRISRTQAFAVAVITPLVFTGAVGAAAPTPMRRDATITPVAVVAPASRDPLGPKVIAIQQQLESFHIAAAAVSAPPPTVVVNSPGALGIPAIALSAYRNAEQIMSASDPACGISWTLLAGIGRIESMHANGGATDARGTAIQPIYGPALDGTLPGNEVIVQSNVSGRVTYARAMGPMQFLPDTWARYASDGKGDGVADPQNLYDSTLAAARYLCSGGHHLRDPTQVMAALLRYNNSMSYAQNVLGWAAAYARAERPGDTVA